jgi:hypothetical protein
MPSRLRLLLALIAISVVMGVVSLFYWIYVYVFLYVPELPNISQSLNFLLITLSTLEMPLFVLVVSLLLMYLTTSKKGMATWSRLLFFAGALFMMASALFNTVYNWWINHLQDYPWSESENMYKVVLAGQLLSALGVLVCIAAALMLIWCYLKGEIHAKPREAPGL